MKRVPLVIAGLAILAIAAVPAYHLIAATHAETAHSGSHSMHSANDGSSLPTEGGQSAFAAIAEIVDLLEADPDTDWAKVNIDALRDHLVDMNSLMLEAKASSAVENDTIKFQVEGEGKVLRAIHAMVPAHAAELNKTGAWTVQAVTTSTGAILTVKTETSSQLEKAKALGFFGLMATGSHHQPHHLAMAMGMMQH
ncbi:hypothetical protein WNZ14_16575 [Hoeflea sp. AS60]|uniref:hypothetical protein n=1 Tax=Hoeflea sp. AS60 TaxID=3135780 RepID=UPI003171D545